MKNITELQNLLRAKYDFLYITTHEEERVVNDLTTIAESSKMSLCTWSFTSGTKVIKGTIEATVEITNSSGKRQATKVEVSNGAFMGQPTKILTIARDCKNDCIFVLYDYHSYFKDAEVTRELKDALSRIKSSYTPIVVISPVLKVPVEIEKLTTIMDYSLPTKEEISEFVGGIIEDISQGENGITISAQTKSDVISACQGLTLKEIANVLTRSLIENDTLDPSAVMHQKKQIIKKSGILEYYEASESMNEVGGMDVLKDWLKKRKCAFEQKAKDFGLPTPKGLLLLGVPGCGKTMMCKAISKAWNIPLLRFDVGAVMQGIVGSSEENMRKVIQTAEASAPCTLWLDEINNTGLLIQ